MSKTTKTFQFPFSVDNSEKYGQVLTTINDKIDNLKKEVSYFDFYNITTSVVDADSFASQLNNLPLSQSLVINTSPFYYNNDSYSQGDIVVKNHLGNIYHIKAQTGGVFYPSKIEKLSGGDYAMSFTFSGSTPTEPEETATQTDDNIWSANIAQAITFQNLEESSTSNIYGYWLQMNNPIFLNKDENSSLLGYGVYFRAFNVNDNPVKPFLKFYFSDGTNSEEEVFIDYFLQIDSTNTEYCVFVKELNDKLYVKVK